MTTFAERIKKWRMNRGYTQEQLAQHAGMTKDFVSKIERGEHKNPTIKSLEAIAQALHITPDKLFLGERRGTEGGKSSKIKEVIPHYGVSPGNFEITIIGRAYASGGSIAAQAKILEKEGGLDKFKKYNIKIPIKSTVYGLEVEGDSMAPKLCAGDIAFADKVFGSVKNGDLAVVKMKSWKLPMVKRVYTQGGKNFILSSINSAHAPIEAHHKHITYFHEFLFSIDKSKVDKIISRIG